MSSPPRGDRSPVASPTSGSTRTTDAEGGPTDANPASGPEDETDAPEAASAGSAPAYAKGLRTWLLGAPLSPRAHVAAGIVLPMVLVASLAWRARGFTSEEAFVSFRYAENFAAGHGLVFNAGERIEGYASFLWTLLLGLLGKAGADVEGAAKVLGAACACAALIPLFLLAKRFQPLRVVPCLATWLLASSFVFDGHAVSGLETSLAVLLALTGTELFARERDARAPVLPISGSILALATLTRPEVALLFGLLLASEGRRVKSREGLLRVAAFAVPVIAHLLWRKSYYGAWAPGALVARAGSLQELMRIGSDYVEKYVLFAGAFLWLGLGSISASALGLLERSTRARIPMAVGSYVILYGVYAILVGGDGAPFYRLLGPIEPFAFLLVDHAARMLLARRERAITLALALFAAWTIFHRARTMGDGLVTTQNDMASREATAGRVAEILLTKHEPGTVALIDIGYLGHKLKWPVVDLSGVATPEIARLPGGNNKKVGPGFTDAVFAREPRYVILSSTTRDCRSPSAAPTREILNDDRFKAFRLRETVPVRGGTNAWCIWER